MTTKSRPLRKEKRKTGEHMTNTSRFMPWTFFAQPLPAMMRARTLCVCALLIATLSGCLDLSTVEKRRAEWRENGQTVQRDDNWFQNKQSPEIPLLSRGDVIDPVAGLVRDDYTDHFYTSADAFLNQEDGPSDLPGLQSLLAKPEEPILQNDKLVSLMVTEDVPLKDVLIELSRRADVDVEIDPKIQGGIIFRAKERPFSEVIDRIANLAGLRYRVENGVLKIMRDLPRIVNYRMNMLNISRSSQSVMRTQTVIGGSESGDGGSETGSETQIDTATNQGDLWGVVEEGVQNILAQYTYGETEGLTPGILSTNRGAGIISVLATDQQHRAIKSYLDTVYQNQSAQVLIEAKVMEVVLDDQYRTGIKWGLSRLTDGGTEGFQASTSFLNQANDSLGLSALTAGGAGVSSFEVLPTELFGINNTSIDLAATLVEKFGVTRTLSNPRITTTNNQTAAFTFARQFVYFETEVEEETEEGTGSGGLDTTTLTVEAEPKTLPIGVLLTLQPSIDLENNEIMMSVRPTLTRVVGEKKDPGVEFITQNAGSSIDVTSIIPEVEVREMDTVLRMSSGQVTVIGGLMEERTINADEGMPGVSKLPVLGNAFKSTDQVTRVIETVIFLKATIIPGSAVVAEDQEFYHKFSRGSRIF